MSGLGWRRCTLGSSRMILKVEGKGWSQYSRAKVVLCHTTHTHTPESVGERGHWPLPSLLPRRRMQPTGGDPASVLLPVVVAAAATVSGD